MPVAVSYPFLALLRCPLRAVRGPDGTQGPRALQGGGRRRPLHRRGGGRQEEVCCIAATLCHITPAAPSSSPPLDHQAYGLANPTVFASEAIQTMIGLTEGEYKGKIVIIMGAWVPATALSSLLLCT